jgi:precorrin-6Y C5,15-methyltransferase (decarboxylating)
MNKIYLIGCGSTSVNAIPSKTVEIIMDAGLVIGSKALIDAFSGYIAGRALPLTRSVEIVEKLAEYGQKYKDEYSVVLYSGDTGFWSGALPVSQGLEQSGIPYEMIPGISSMQMLSARLRIPYNDWHVVSLYGILNSYADLQRGVISGIMTGKTTFVLMGGMVHARDVAKVLTDAGLGGITMAVGENLFRKDERIARMKASEMESQVFGDNSVALIEAVPGLPMHSVGLKDEMFVSGKNPVIPQMTRCAVLSYLEIQDGDTFWDLGAGSGSLSVETALINRGGLVFSVEASEDALELLKANRERFGCYNIWVRKGTAPEALKGLGRPTVVFIGEKGGRIDELIPTLYSINPGVRIVALAESMDRMIEVHSVLQQYGMKYGIMELSVSQSRIAKDFHVLKPDRPCYIIKTSFSSVLKKTSVESRKTREAEEKKNVPDDTGTSSKSTEDTPENASEKCSVEGTASYCSLPRTAY